MSEQGKLRCCEWLHLSNGITTSWNSARNGHYAGNRIMPIADEDLEWVVRLALESRRRVKEQQKRCFKSEFRSTHFSFTLGAEGVEQFVATPELHSDEAI